MESRIKGSKPTHKEVFPNDGALPVLPFSIVQHLFLNKKGKWLKKTSENFRFKLFFTAFMIENKNQLLSKFNPVLFIYAAFKAKSGTGGMLLPVNLTKTKAHYIGNT